MIKALLLSMLICSTALAEVDVLPSLSTEQDKAVLNENLRQLDQRVRTLANQTTPIISLTTGVSGVLPIANGGTGQSTQQDAINALTLSSSSTNEYVLTKDTATGNAKFKAIPTQTQYLNLISTTTIASNETNSTGSGDIAITSTKNYMVIADLQLNDNGIWAIRFNNDSSGNYKSYYSINAAASVTASTDKIDTIDSGNGMYFQAIFYISPSLRNSSTMTIKGTQTSLKNNATVFQHSMFWGQWSNTTATSFRIMSPVQSWGASTVRLYEIVQ